MVSNSKKKKLGTLQGYKRIHYLNLVEIVKESVQNVQAQTAPFPEKFLPF